MIYKSVEGQTLTEQIDFLEKRIAQNTELYGRAKCKSCVRPQMLRLEADKMHLYRLKEKLKTE